MFTQGILYILYHWLVIYKPSLIIYSMKKEELPLEYAENWKIHIFDICEPTRRMGTPRGI